MPFLPSAVRVISAIVRSFSGDDATLVAWMSGYSSRRPIMHRAMSLTESSMSGSTGKVMKITAAFSSGSITETAMDPGSNVSCCTVQPSGL